MTALAHKVEEKEMTESNQQPSDIQVELQNVKDDLTVLKDNLAGLVKLVAAKGVGSMTRTKDQLVETGMEAFETTAEYTHKQVNRAEKTIQKNPFLFVGGALAAGMLAAKGAEKLTDR